MNKQRVLILGVTSGVVIVGGIIMAVLLSQIVATAVDGSREGTDDQNWKAVGSMSGAVAVFGLVYIIPGVIGLIAAFVQNKCMYVTTCIFTMICLVIMALVVLLAGLGLLALIFSTGKVSEVCIDDGHCKCRSAVEEDGYTDTAFKTCAHFEKVLAIMIALALFVVLSWVATIVEFVVACYFSCRSQASSGTVLMTTQQQPMLQPGIGMSPPPSYSQGGYPVQTYDQGQPLPMKV